MSSQQIVEYKVILLGSVAVGKSSLLQRCLSDQAPRTSQMKSTVGVDIKVKRIILRNQVVKLKIWDTSGQKRFMDVLHMYYKLSRGAIIVYDIQSRDSFEEAMDWVIELREKLSPHLVIVFAGNKADMAENRVISRSEGQEFAALYNLIFMESSSVSGMNAHNCFIELATEIHAQADVMAKKAEETPNMESNCWNFF